MNISTHGSSLNYMSTQEGHDRISAVECANMAALELRGREFPVNGSDYCGFSAQRLNDMPLLH